MKKSTKAVICALMGGLVGFGVYSYKVKQEQLNPNHWVNQFSPDEVHEQDAVTIAAMTQQNKDFSVFVYQCDEVHSYKILINDPKSTPSVKLIESHTDSDNPAIEQVRHFYVTHSDPWRFTDAHGTEWKIEAGQMTGHKGLSDGTVCKFNLQSSTEATMNTEKENYFAATGA